MATLYVENVPDDVYESIRERARAKRSSIAVEVLRVLEVNFPTQRELKARRGFLRQAERARPARAANGKRYASAEEMQREDRSR